MRTRTRESGVARGEAGEEGRRKDADAALGHYGNIMDGGDAHFQEKALG
jgi:hypothetical protein